VEQVQTQIEPQVLRILATDGIVAGLRELAQVALLLLALVLYWRQQVAH
jgi:hypothetical protein